MSNKRIIGIDVVRILAIFTIVAVHCRDGFFYYTPIAVPCLMLTSFYLNFKVFYYCDKNKLFKMIYRIFVPYIFWYLVCLIVTPERPPLYSFNWFFVVIVLLYILFFIIFLFKDKKKSICISFLLLVLCFCLQYSLIHYSIVNSISSDLAIISVLGRICEMIPYASTGLLLAYSDILNKNLSNKKYIQLVCIIIIFLLYIFKMMWLAPSGFDYSGLSKYIATISVFVCLYFIDNKKINNICLFISKPSFGIALNHQIIKSILYSLFTINNRYLDIISIYFVCLLINILIYMLPLKFTKKLVN